jgi:tRNA 5-methylaminomethyl-2-thiouridine biosynthesis bifunctional protein
LARRGCASILFERRSALAQEGSGNAAGVFHGVVHGHDGHHARFHRAAAYEARQAVAEAIAEHGVRGSTSGLLRLASRDTDAAPLLALLDRLGLPADYVRAVSANEAGAIAGIAVPARPGTSWVAAGSSRAGLARAHAERAARTNCRPSGADGRCDPSRRRPLADPSTRARPRVRDGRGRGLANAGAALDLLGGNLGLQSSRGQTSGIPSARWPAAATLRLPLAGSGYLLPSLDGTTWFGASAHEGDVDPALRDDDHRANIERLAGLVDEAARGLAALGRDLRPRPAWRWASPDRLPLIGPVRLAAIGPQLPSRSRRRRAPPYPSRPTVRARERRACSVLSLDWVRAASPALALGAQVLSRSSPVHRAAGGRLCSMRSTRRAYASRAFRAPGAAAATAGLSVSRRSAHDRADPPGSLPIRAIALAGCRRQP